MIPWVTAEDIAAVAYHGLVNKEPPNRDFLVLGPEKLTYAQVSHLVLTGSLSGSLIFSYSLPRH